MLRIAFFTAAVLAISATISLASAGGLDDPGPRERLFYEITVTAPGTRSQGWHGTLFDRDGSALTAKPGDSVATNAGTFVAVACDHLWTPCGHIHEDLLAWMKTNAGNVIMDRKPWVYRLYVRAECSRSEGWRGELIHGGRIIARGKRARTPMGPFVWHKGRYLWDQVGWLHVAWPKAAPAPGTWPCRS
jgi:hypothetical protein